MIGDEQDGLSPEKRRVLVTGACGGLGNAIARQLAQDGFDLILLDIDSDDIGKRLAASATAETGNTATYHRVDVTDRTAMEHCIRTAPPFDVLVTCAGIGRSAPVLELSPDEWDRHMSINLTGAFTAAQLSAQHMVAAQRPGLLLFLSSWIGSIPWPEMTAYSVTKAGIEMLAKQFARELAPQGIRANVVAPGIVNGGMAKIQLENDPAYAARASRVIPLKSFQTEDDVAKVVSFLCSPGARYMTGSKVTADGGCSLFAFD